MEKVKRRKWQPCALCLHGRIKPFIKGQSSQQSCHSDNSYRKKWTITMRNWQGKSPELCHFSTTTVGGCALTLVCASRAWIHTTGGSLLSLGKGMLCYEEEHVPFLWKGSSACILLHQSCSLILGLVCYHGVAGIFYWAVNLIMKYEDKLLPTSVIVDEYVLAYSKLVAYSLRLKPNILMLVFGPCAL